MRAEDILPDDASHAVFDGMVLRKGTVAAFLHNARAWMSDDIDVAKRSEIENEMRAALPALRTLGIFDVFDIRDARLKYFLV